MLIDVGGAALHCRLDGPAAAPALVLSNSLGADLAMWDDQVPALAGRFRVLRYDTRGHGGSSAPAGPYTIERLGRDVVALLDHFGIARAHFCGLSLGGVTGLWLGIHAPARIARLVLANTAATIGPPENWDARIARVNAGGMAAISQAVLERWFTPAFRAAQPARVAALRATMEAVSPEGYVACCAALRGNDLRDAVAAVAAPTLVIAGTHDAATPPADGRFLADRIPGARYVELDAAHVSNIEAAPAFTGALLDFLADPENAAMDERERHAAGTKVRRAVLGDAHVDRALAHRTAFDEEFQDLITRYACGEVWTRPGLPRHTRSLVTLALMVALNRGDEFRLHVRAAFNNGVTRDEIKEVLLQCAIYCGVPAANTAFHLARDVFAEIDAAGGTPGAR